MKDLLKNKAFILASLVVIGIAIQFWAGSRIPQLDQKAMMAGSAAIEPISFNTVLIAEETDPAWKKIAYGFVNWAKTNQRGMTFGFMFAAAILCLLSMLKRKSLEGNFSNSLLGVMIGTPLGVCVNCAAPIARGLHASGMRLETTLAAMLSSPTLNIIVVTMVFALFPLYMVALKIGATLFFLLIVLPLLARFVFKDEVMSTTGKQAMENANPEDAKFTALNSEAPTVIEEANWWPALKWLVINYIRNFWFIIKATLPLMILAGLLGSIMVTMVPLDFLAEVLPKSPALYVLAGMLVVALVGVFLPVPIAFDVVVTAVLIAAGMPVKYAMILLFTLGIYSVYSYLIVDQAISRRVALWLYGSITIVGIGVGIIAHEYEKFDTIRKQEFLMALWESLDSEIPVNLPAGPTGKPAAELLPQIEAGKRVAKPFSVVAPADISVGVLPNAAPTRGDGRLYNRTAGPDMGIDLPYQFSVIKWIEPHSEFRGISSGDVHGDGWPDLLVTSERGLYLFVNNQGQFEQQTILGNNLQDTYVMNAALVDIDNDGMLDIYYSTYQDGNYVVYNDAGRFTVDQRIRLPNLDGAWSTTAPSFGDLDKDGDLDIVLGNWTMGAFLSRLIVGRESSRNAILWNNDGNFLIEALEGLPGETLTSIITDFNNDDNLDIIIGNDFQVPDMYYLGDGKGGFRLIKRKDKMIPVTTLLTMSIDSGDLDNDLVPELYFGNMSGTNHSEVIDMEQICTEGVVGTQYFAECQRIRDDQFKVNMALRRKDPTMCMDLSDPEYSTQCIAISIHLDSWWGNKPELCESLQGKQTTLYTICSEFFRIEDEPMGKTFYSHVQQGAQRTNVLLIPAGDGKFVDKALEYNVRDAGWIWNAKFADLDQDEYLDLYVANGQFMEDIKDARESNQWFQNQSGTSFKDKTAEVGLEMFEETSSYTYVDFDNDGDTDVIAVEQLGPVWLYISHQNANNSISFSLQDSKGNVNGIGSKLIIHYGEDGSRHQLRELRTSGGFVSYDAPVAMFGLGSYESVSKVEVVWSTGEKTELTGNFVNGQHYVISRDAG